MKFKTIWACIVKILNLLKVAKRKPKNKSEELFEQYLDSNGLKGKYTYEPSITGKSKKPDYLLKYNGQECFFEVKELRKKDNEPTKWPAYIDPYTGLREEINEARKQFKQFKDYLCSLVVFNIDDKQARLDPQTIFGAMLGDLGFAATFNAADGKAIAETGRNVFLDGGKMINYKRKQPQNTTISAIIVLEDNFVDDSKYQTAINEEVKRQNRLLTGIERFAIAEVEGHHSSRVTRVVVVENPFARIAFPENLFIGPFDERWRWVKENGEIERVFVGNKLKELEELKNEE